MHRSSDRSSIHTTAVQHHSTTGLDLPGRADRFLICMICMICMICYDLYDTAHVAGWEPYYPHDLAHVSWVGSVLHRYSTASHNGGLGSSVDDLDCDLSDPFDLGIFATVDCCSCALVESEGKTKIKKPKKRRFWVERRGSPASPRSKEAHTWRAACRLSIYWRLRWLRLTVQDLSLIHI